MELRDYVAIGSLSVALASLAFNWLSARGVAQTATDRDELARFASDGHARSVFSGDAREAARMASAYLSLELAEKARRTAAKHAKRAARFWPRVFTVGTIAFATAAVSAFAATVPREPAVNPVIDGFISFYLWFFAVAMLLGGLGYIVDLQRLHKATPNLRKLFGDVASSARLDAIDARSRDQDRARRQQGRMRTARLRQPASLRRTRGT